MRSIQAEALSAKRAQPRLAQRRFGSFVNRSTLAWSGLVLILICLIGFSLSGIALASQDSLPGDSLYAVKAAIEETRLSLTLEASQRARLRMEFAERRLDEAKQLSEHGRYDEVPLALTNYQVQLHLALQEVKQAVHTQPLQAQQLNEDIQTRLQHQITVLAGLESDMPLSLAQAIQQAQAASEQASSTAISLFAEATATVTPTPTAPSAASPTQPAGAIPSSATPSLPVIQPPSWTATQESLPPGLQRQTQTPTPRPSLTPRPTNTHRPTQVIIPSKTPKPTQVKPPQPTPKPPNPNKPTSPPQPPGQSKPTKTPKK